MGVPCFSKCSSSPYAIQNSNPDPKNFVIKDVWELGNYAVVVVNYPDAKNFEGDKVLVFDVSELGSFPQDIKELDPHFSNTQFAPIARFKPTFKGWHMAISFVHMLNQEDLEYKKNE